MSADKYVGRRNNRALCQIFNGYRIFGVNLLVTPLTLGMKPTVFKK